MAPTYIMIVSEKNACQITRNESCDINPIYIHLKNNNKIENTFDNYLIQTNIDHWKYETIKSNSKSNDTNDENENESDIDCMQSVPRLQLCEKYIEKCQSKQELINLLNTYPIYEKECTIYTTIIDISKLDYKTIRFCWVKHTPRYVVID